jgi:hypothetical protein
MTSIISSNSLSYESILHDLTSYVQSITDYQVKWKDFYEGGAGSTILELISGLGTFINYVAMANRRETYLPEAKLTTSIVAIATTLGYPVNRINSTQLSLTVFFTDYITWDKSNPIGFYNGVSVSLVEDGYFIPGNNTFTVVLGTWTTFNYTSNSTAPFTKVLVRDTIDNTFFNLKVNGNLVNIVNNAESLTSTNVLQRTYYYGVFLIFGDDILGKQLNSGDVLVFEYISPGTTTNDVSFNQNTLSLNKGQLISGYIITYGSPSDSNSKLVTVAPGYYSTRRRLISLADYNYIGLSYQGIASVNVIKTPGICCSVNLAYVTYSGRVLLPTEKTAYLNYLNSYSLLGTTISLIDPQIIYVNISMLIIITKVANTGNITTTITNYLNSMTNKLGALFSVNGVFSLGIDGVARVYLDYPLVDRLADYYQYFIISNLDIQYSVDTTMVGSMGTNPSLGYTPSS